MTLGIKVGPQRQNFLDLEQTNAPFAEVWFNIGRAAGCPSAAGIAIANDFVHTATDPVSNIWDF